MKCWVYCIFISPLCCLFTPSGSLNFLYHFSSGAGWWLLHLCIYVSSRRQSTGFLERKCRWTGCLDSVMLECDFLAAVVTGKKLAEVVKDKHQSFFSYHTSECLCVGKWGIVPWKGGIWDALSFGFCCQREDGLQRFSKQTSARRAASFLTGFGSGPVFSSWWRKLMPCCSFYDFTWPLGRYSKEGVCAAF